MNDAYRGMIIVVSLVSLYMAIRLAVVYLRHWRKDRRWWLMPHVFYLTLALLVTTSLISYVIGTATGTNEPLSVLEIFRLVQVLLICAGLRPLWVHHQSIAQKRSDQT